VEEGRFAPMGQVPSKPWSHNGQAIAKRIHVQFVRSPGAPIGPGSPEQLPPGEAVRLLTHYGCGPVQFSGIHQDQTEWTHGVVLNLAGSEKFSSDRAIAEYATGIWNAKPCPVG
jgi:hypothetical protein